ncbi:hypothetical protein DJ82_11160 [Halorubrum sp. Ib24]|nr:hypothetical protein DJ82_11160 [Halorubrum sp. Ib24]
MRRRKFLKGVFDQATLGAAVSIIIGLFEVWCPGVWSYLSTDTRPTSITTESNISRITNDNRYILTYNWSDQSNWRWRSEFSIKQSVYAEAAEQSHGYFSAYEDAKTSRHVERLTERFATTTLVEGNPDQPLSESARFERALGFVHSLEYMTDIDTKGVPEYIRPAEETLVDGGGDCEDLTYLLAGIRSQPSFGYRTAMVLLPGHMLVGVHKNDLPVAYTGAPTLPGDEYVAMESVRPQPVGVYRDEPVLAIYNDGFEYVDRSAVIDTTTKFFQDPTEFQTVADLRI